MADQFSHTRILSLPEGQLPAGGHLETLQVQNHGAQCDLLLDYQELHITAPVALFERESRPWEQLRGVYQPRCLQFTTAKIINGAELVGHLNDVPADSPNRSLTMAFAFRTPENQNYYIFGIQDKAFPGIVFIARKCTALECTGPSWEVVLSRDWSPAPSSPARMVPKLRRFHRRFGGDPVAIRINGRLHRQRLFTGGVDIQGEQRPDVQAVLNVGETASRWLTGTSASATDRWDNKGEGSVGMDVRTIIEEAGWVIERLVAGQRVLVHCAAGMNRSATICCAVLILLEGLSAETALTRLREQHPWALPDPHHWLMLRWLAKTNI